MRQDCVVWKDEGRVSKKIGRALNENLNKIIKITGPGCRNRSTIVSVDKTDNDRHCFTGGEECIRAAIAMHNEPELFRRFLHSRKHELKTLGSGSTWLEQVTGTYCLRDVHIPSGVDKLAWIASQREKV